MEPMQEKSQNIQQWIIQAQALEQAVNPLNLPLEVMLQEAVQVACALKQRWEPHGKIPGLRALPDLALSHADDILSVVRAVQEAQFLCYLEDASAPLKEEEPPLVKARRLITELQRPLEYLLDTLPMIEQERVKKFKALPEQKQEDNASLFLLLRLYTEPHLSVPTRSSHRE